MTHNPTLDLVITRDLKASRDRLWRAWTEPDLLAQWWTPKPWTTEVKALDVRPGGAFDTIMCGPDGERHEGPGAFIHVEPKRVIVFTSVLQEGWRPVAEPGFPMTATITMDERGSGSRYTAHVLHATEAHRKQHEDTGFFDGWGTMIDQLDALALTLEDA